MTYFNRIDSTGNPHSADLPVFHKTVTEATTLDKDDNGQTIVLKAAAGAAVTLPAVADIIAGYKLKFVIGQLFATTNWTVVSATNVIQGSAIVAGAHVAAVDENTISFVATADSIGDFIELEFDGTNFLASGSGVNSGSITFTAP